MRAGNGGVSFLFKCVQMPFQGLPVGAAGGQGVQERLPALPSAQAARGLEAFLEPPPAVVVDPAMPMGEEFATGGAERLSGKSSHAGGGFRPAA
jgi:hypothetical protein